MTAQIVYNRATGNLILDGKILEDGQYLKVLVVNGLNNKAEWVNTKLLMDVEGVWFLEGLWGYKPVGLFAEIPGEPKIRVASSR